MLLCFGESCCRTIIADTEFGARNGVLLKQKLKNVATALGPGGEWMSLKRLLVEALEEVILEGLKKVRNMLL